MTTRRLVLHLIVGLLTFLIGVTIAVALGGFDPLAGFTRHSYRQQYAIPPQSLSVPYSGTESYGGCRKARTRTADLRRYDTDSLIPPPPQPPLAPAVPLDDAGAPQPQQPSAPRPSR